MAFYEPKHRRVNDGCAAFLVGVEGISGQLAAIPCKDVTQSSWKKAIIIMMETSFNAFRVAITDRDCAITGRAFKTEMKNKYGLSWFHLYHHNKCFAAENMIGFLKRKVTQICMANNHKKWTSVLPGLIRRYNNEKIGKTNIVRKDVDQYNYLDLIGALKNVDDPTILFNLSGGNAYHPEVSKLIWNYEVGTRVVVARRVDYTLEDQTIFTKPSVKGHFGPKVYTITDRELRHSGDLYIVPIYKVGQLAGYFNESELRPARWVDEEEKEMPPLAAKRPATRSQTIRQLPMMKRRRLEN